MPITARPCFAYRWRCVALALLVCLMPAGPAAQAWPEHEEARHEAHIEELHELLEMLEHGIVATDRMGAHELRNALRELSEELRFDIEHAHDRHALERERREREHRTQEREVHERELAARHREREAHERELAARERQHEARAREREAVERQRQARERGNEARDRRREARERDRARQREAREHGRGARGRVARSDESRAVTERRLEMMHTAMPALREAGHMDSAERLGRAIRAAEVALEDGRSAEARRVRESAPAPGELIMLIMEASALWDEFGHETKAATLRAYADEMLAGRPTPRRLAARSERRRAADPDAMLLDRLDRLEERLGELEQMLRRLDDDEPGLMR